MEQARSGTDWSNTNWRGYRFAAWGELVLLGIAVVVAAMQGKWQGALVLVGFGIAAIVFLMATEHVPALVDLVVVIAALANAAGFVWNLYGQFAWFDEVVHGYTLFALTLPLGFLAFQSVLDSFGENRLPLILAIASFGIALGALWEIAEWLYDQFVAGNVILGKFDTMVDLVVDSVGAVLAAWFSTWVVKDRVDGTWR